MAKSRKKPRKPRKRVSHAQRPRLVNLYSLLVDRAPLVERELLDAAWNFAVSYCDDASNAETHEEEMVAAIRRILREVARG